MSKKINYSSAETFMCVCAQNDVLPAIHWRGGLEGYKGYIYFIPSKYVIEKGEMHVFYSSNKKLLDAIWNSIGLMRRALKMINDCEVEG